MKSPITLSALAAVLASSAGAASAQSSNVTLYGIVDQQVIKMNNATSVGANPGAGNNNQWNLKQGAQSRLGFRGLEDLGDGMSAFFQLEHRFTADDGVAVTPFWAARSVVGLRSNTLGEMTLGREYLPAFWPAVTADPWGWDTIGQLGRFYSWANYAGGDGAGIRDNNTVQLKSAAWSGLTGTASVALGEGGATRGRAMGGSLVYADGPLYAGLAFDRANNADPSKPKAQLWLLSATYEINGIRPSALLAQARSFTGVTTKSMLLGLRWAIGPGQLRAAYARNDPDGADNTSSKLSAGYFYSLSKRTTLYTDVGSAKTDKLTRSTGIDAGIKHVF